MRKYGVENFTLKVVKECSEEDLYYWEWYYIDKFKASNREFGYNMTDFLQYGSIFKGNINRDNYYDLVDNLMNTNISKKSLSDKYNIALRTIYSINNGESLYHNELNYPLRKKRQKVNVNKKINEKKDFVRKLKFNLKKEEIEDLLKYCPNFIKIAELIGVSDNALNKRCRKLGINSSSKYWRDLYFKNNGYTYETYVNYYNLKQYNKNLFDFIVANIDTKSRYYFVGQNNLISKKVYDLIKLKYKCNR